jgi:hypothetical protein
MPLSLNLSDFIGSILSHVAHGYVEALTSCLFIALARAAWIGSLTPTYRKQHRVR